MEMCMPRALKGKLAAGLQIPWLNLAHFCCAEFCHPKSRLFLIFPSPRYAGCTGTCLSLVGFVVCLCLSKLYHRGSKSQRRHPERLLRRTWDTYPLQPRHAGGCARQPMPLVGSSCKLVLKSDEVLMEDLYSVGFVGGTMGNGWATMASSSRRGGGTRLEATHKRQTLQHAAAQGIQQALLGRTYLLTHSQQAYAYAAIRRCEA